ncbi:MAG: glycosyltransferase [Pseudomonadota bacterium]
MAAEAQPATASPPYTVVLTSCGRFDLLAPTIASFLNHADAKPAEFIVIEDSGDARVRDALAPLEDALGGAFTVLINESQLGQMQAIDRAYAAVKTAHVFHCEDDWEFFRSGFIAESFRLLEALPRASMVGLRPRSEQNDLVKDSPMRSLSGPRLDYFELDPAKHPEYFSYSFNPGLRRMADARALSPFAPLGGEADVSYAFKKAGFHIANLEDPAVRHIGDGRHVVDPTAPDKPKTLLERLARSTRKRVKRVKRALRGD